MRQALFTCCVALLSIGWAAQSVFAQNPPATKPGGTSAGVCRHDPCGGEQKSKCFQGNYDGRPGIIYISQGERGHHDPSMDSPVEGDRYPRGTSVMFTSVKDINGTFWYYVHPYGRTPNWVPSSGVSCSHPPPLPPGKPLRLQDLGLEGAHPVASMTSADNG
jgi:hypothetical protein